MPLNGNVNPAQTAGKPFDSPLPGARAALLLLLVINLFNYIDRQVLAAVIPKIRDGLFTSKSTLVGPADQSMTVRFVEWLKESVGLTGDNALIGSLSMAFIFAYMIFAPIFGWLADRMSRWILVGIGVILWSL